jgi:Uma2 family endonuclease
MPLATTHRFSVEAYYRMAETGVIGPDARVELLDGEIIDMSPIGPLHGGVVNRLLRLFARLSSGRFLLTVQNPVRLDDYSEPQPDLMLLKPVPDDYTVRHPGPEDVFLLIEVAASSLAYDRGTKLPAYGRAGILEVWIVNLEDEAIEVYREPHLAGYASTTLLRPGETVRPLAFPDAAVDVAELFKTGQ